MSAATIPRTMKAVLLRGHGGYEQLDYREDVPVPAPGAGEVLLRVLAAGLNNTDINTRIGWYSKSVDGATDDSVSAAAPAATDGGWTGAPFEFPRVQGADVCGRIVAVGAGIGDARLGERVLVDPVLRGSGGAKDGVRYLGADCDGGFAEYVVVPAANALRVQCDWSDVELASLPCAYGAAENMLERAAVAPGERVLVTGASGGVGSAAVQLARRRGADVVALAGAGKSAALLALGARRVLGRDAHLAAEIGAASIDVVVDVVGGGQFGSLLEVLRPGGRYAVAGAIAGPRVELDLRTLYLKDLSLFGCTVTPPQVFANLVRYVERAEIRPLVNATWALARIVEAQVAFLNRAHTGKIVLVP